MQMVYLETQWVMDRKVTRWWWWAATISNHWLHIYNTGLRKFGRRKNYSAALLTDVKRALHALVEFRNSRWSAAGHYNPGGKSPGEQVRTYFQFNGLTKLGITPVHCSQQCCEDFKLGSHKVDTLQMMRMDCPRIVSLLSVAQGSSGDTADVDIQWTQRDVQNNDKWWLVWLTEVFCGFSPSREPRNSC